MYLHNKGRINKIIGKWVATLLKKRKYWITPYDTIFKVVLFGEDGVGTSSLLKLTTSDYIYDTKLTIGVDLWVKKNTKDLDLHEKVLEVEGRTVKLLILRLSNEERFKYLQPRYVRTANGAIFMYDITNHSTLDNIPEWTQIIRESAGDIPIVLVGGKADLPNREVNKEEGNQIANSRKFDAFIECSAKTEERVEEIFKTLSKLLLQRLNL